MGILDGYDFYNKLNMYGVPHAIVDEPLDLIDGMWEGYIIHDQIVDGTLEIYTQSGKKGDRVLNYTIELTEMTWKTYLKVYHASSKLYLCYESLGDIVEADDVNMVQAALSSLEVVLDQQVKDFNVHAEDKVSHVTQANRDTWDSKAFQSDLDITNQNLTIHNTTYNNPHRVTKVQVGLGRVDDIKQATKEEFDLHKENTSNPHLVTKSQVGLSQVSNVEQASKQEFNQHINNITDHLTQIERESWNDKYTKNEVDNKFATLETNTDWKEAVSSFNDIATTYPNPHDGWTVNTKDTDYTYRYNGSMWVVISANAIPKATTSVDGLLTKEDKTLYDDANAKKHTHGNKSVIDTITMALTDKWNQAFNHIADAIKHITGAERTLWNTVSNKLDKTGGTVTGAIKKTGLGWGVMIVNGTARSGVYASSTVGEHLFGGNNLSDESNISEYVRVGTNKLEYTTGGTTHKIYHAGSKPTASDVGLGSVNNTSDVNKPISAAMQNALNLKAPKSHEHSQYVTQTDLGNAGYGDMRKSIYDKNNNGVIDKAENVDWTGVLNKPTTFSPSTHTHTNILKIDDRDRKPTDTEKGCIEAVFTSLGGMTGASNSDYQDMLVLNTYTDPSGGKVNALLIDKSEFKIKHYQANQSDTTWGVPKTVAYEENVIKKGVPLTWNQLKGV